MMSTIASKRTICWVGVCLVAILAVVLAVSAILARARRDVIECELRHGRNDSSVSLGLVVRPAGSDWFSGVLVTNPRRGKSILRLSFIIHDSRGSPFGRIEWGLREMAVVREIYWQAPWSSVPAH